jgi:hypothetical protein
MYGFSLFVKAQGARSQNGGDRDTSGVYRLESQPGTYVHQVVEVRS